MTGNQPSRVVSDIGTLKALASPVRWQILSYLGEHEEATATDLARALGESTGTTSYHLRLLARHGLVEEAASAGKRERPWRKVPQDLRFPPVGEDTPAAERDAHLAVHRLRLAEDLAHLAALAERDKPEEMAWSRISRSSVRVSQPQLEQFGAEFQALVARYADLAAQAAPGEPTELVQLRLYAFPAAGTNGAAGSPALHIARALRRAHTRPGEDHRSTAEVSRRRHAGPDPDQPRGQPAAARGPDRAQRAARRGGLQQ